MVLITFFFPDPGFNPGACITFSCDVPIAYFNLELPQSLLVFHDMNIFEDDKPVVLWNFPWIRFAWCFLVIRLGLCLLGRNTTQGMLWPSQCPPSGDTWYWFVPLLGMLMLITRLGCSLPDSSMEKPLYSETMRRAFDYISVPYVVWLI